ncbi:RagB/SusD family nutrient uptake outer membrane protein [Flavobacterium sp. NST-5]|uniref:RagB/SusD family nutrient uptake outer membrane protein n=1 Tax=Flavobacterium ichthyis TaxID=2698827 RepID=A0ABW9Z762_9FLAO|nr:RagB/SusD family nutrient uptake outer membrane protein [Flavobacterium ichthyis]NBL64402.1 RagB/SusD family nutrient uptake outer membrane protein [Flavobacterium ichthyis]
MKNKFFKIIIAVFGITVFYSCDDQIDDYQPYDAVVLETFYQTPSDFEQASTALYSAFRSAGYYDGGGSAGGLIIVPDILSDNLIFNTEGRQSGRNTAEFTYNTNNTPTAIYGSAYRSISRANLIIDQIDNLNDGAFKNNILGQALAIRGLCHFDVARFYSKIPTQSADANNSIGIAYSKTYDPQARPARLETVQETYAEIINDLETASTLIATDNGEGKLDLAAVKGLLSRVYLYQGNHVLAAQRAQESIDAGATLVSRANFRATWLDSNSDDVLFKVKITQQDNVFIGNDYNQLLNGQLYSEYVCDFGLFQLYQNSDIRKTAYIQTSQTGDFTYNHIIKYYQNASGLRFVDGKYLRTSEVYLNMAEAKFRNNDEAGALAALNMVRTRRYSPYTPGSESGQGLWNAIMLERRLELAFESDRFFTLKRLGLGLQRSGFGHLADGAGNIAFPQTVPASSHLWQLPISQLALNSNPNIIPNPDYQN